MNPFGDPKTAEVQVQVARDWLAERKRLREARAKWIEENECPVQFGNTLIDSEGKVWASPFQIGCQQHEWEEMPVRIIQPGDELLAKERMTPPLTAEGYRELLDGCEEILAESSAGDGDVARTSSDGKHIFLVGESDRSPHPAIHEGEDYGEYCQRVGRAYEAAAGAGRADAGADGVRNTSPADPACFARADVSGTGAGGPDGAPNLDCEPGGMLAEESVIVAEYGPGECLYPRELFRPGGGLRSSFAARCLRAVRRLWKAGQRARLRYLRR
jgi:hypothetical protein